jgi:hypothetical protein
MPNDELRASTFEFRPSSFSFSVAPCLRGELVCSPHARRITTGILRNLDGAAAGQVDDPTLWFFTGVKGCVSFRSRLSHGSTRLGMIGELAARRRGNQVHVIPVSPGVDCGSRALTPLLSTRFGGRKLITDALSFGVTCRLQADRCRAIGQGIDGTPLLPLRGNDRTRSTQSFVERADSILHAVSATEVRGPCDL